MAKDNQKGGKSKEYYLRNFQHNIGPIDFNEMDSQYASFINARLMGFYYEARVYYELVQLNKEFSTFEPDNDQKKGIDAFARIDSYAPTSDAGRNKKAASIALRKAIEDAAKKAAKEFMDKVEKELQTKNIEVKDIQRASSAGDVIVKAIEGALKGKSLVLEVKWQDTEGKPVQWFQLIDANLFGKNNTFQQFLVDKKMWKFNLPDGVWEDHVATAMLDLFLDERISKNNEAVLNYLLQKGEAQKMFDTQNQVVGRYTTHGMKSSMDIKNLSEILDVLQPSGSRSFTKKVGQNFYTRRKFYQYVLAFEKNNEQVAWFGVDKLKNEATPAGQQRDPGKLFTFKMWIMQKAFHK